MNSDDAHLDDETGGQREQHRHRIREGPTPGHRHKIREAMSTGIKIRIAIRMARAKKAMSSAGTKSTA